MPFQHTFFCLNLVLTVDIGGANVLSARLFLDLLSSVLQVTGRCGSVLVRLIPAPRGTGIVSAPVPKKLLMMAGIDDCYTSARGCTATLGNFGELGRSWWFGVEGRWMMGLGSLVSCIILWCWRCFMGEKGMSAVMHGRISSVVYVYLSLKLFLMFMSYSDLGQHGIF